VFDKKRRNYDTFPQFYRKYDIFPDFPALIAAVCPGMQLAPKREMAQRIGKQTAAGVHITAVLFVFAAKWKAPVRYIVFQCK